jgi:hypothetical protein
MYIHLWQRRKRVERGKSEKDGNKCDQSQKVRPLLQPLRPPFHTLHHSWVALLRREWVGTAVCINLPAPNLCPCFPPSPSLPNHATQPSQAHFLQVRFLLSLCSSNPRSPGCWIYREGDEDRRRRSMRFAAFVSDSELQLRKRKRGGRTGRSWVGMSSCPIQHIMVFL